MVWKPMRMSLDGQVQLQLGRDWNWIKMLMGWAFIRLDFPCGWKGNSVWLMVWLTNIGTSSFSFFFLFIFIFNFFFLCGLWIVENTYVFSLAHMFIFGVGRALDGEEVLLVV